MLQRAGERTEQAGVGNAAAPVRFLDLSRESAALRAPLHAALDRVLDRGVFLFGEEVARLESQIAARSDVRYAIGVSSGTAALQILLHAHGVGPGDEVITTPASFYATAKAVHLVGARAVFADVDPDSYNLDPAAVEARITPRTRAILVVHLYGRPAPVRELQRIADRHGVALLEDAAQALGAAVEGRAVGSFGAGGILSFYPTKNLGALGDAGMVVTDDASIAERCRSLRFLGFAGERDHFDRIGVSGRMDEIQAAFLSVKLGHLDEWLARRRGLAARYDRLLPPQIVRRPTAATEVDARHLYVVRTSRRDELARRLAACAIESQVHYRVPLHRQALFRDAGASLPVAESWCREVLSLPLHPWLREDEQDRVIETVGAFAREE